MITKKSDRDAILENAHLGTGGSGSSKHVDSEAMLAQIEPYYQWSDIKLDIDDWVYKVTLFSLKYRLAFTRGHTDRVLTFDPG